ncbi:helix-turn-helix domain-containing protein [Microbacterium sp. NPDC007973]|uniref:helix-turn-helix domain-containing protein n=1 Tax=Microbacterium sp. NPDC007973 TaxID=3364182 RepID=UPI0036EFD790
MWRQWLDHATRQDSDREIARKAGLTHSTVSRWRNAGTAPAEGIIRIARAYAADPIDALVSAGIITEDDLMNGGLRNAVRHAPTAYLTEELHERVTTGRLHGGFGELRRMFRAWSTR